MVSITVKIPVVETAVSAGPSLGAGTMPSDVTPIFRRDVVMIDTIG